MTGINAVGQSQWIVGVTGRSAWTVEAVGQGELSISPLPTAPTNLTATANGTSQIDLAWTDNSDSETGFVIERSTTSGSGFAEIATTAADATSYNDTGLDDDTTYYYRIKATNAAGNSAYTDEASATTDLAVPAAPTSLTATKNSGSPTDSIDLAWTDNADNETSYKIYRGTSSGSLSLIDTIATDSTTYADTGLSEGTTYYYEVRASNAAGDSDASNEASAATDTSFLLQHTMSNPDGTELDVATLDTSGTYDAVSGVAECVISGGKVVRDTTGFRNIGANKDIGVVASRAQGDVEFGGTTNNCAVGFGTTNALAGPSAWADSNGSQLAIRISNSVVASTPYTYSTGVVYTVRLDYDSGTNELTATLLDSGGSVLATVSYTHTAISDTNVAWHIGSTPGATFDNFEVT